jgi:hypothetical protein
MTKGYNENFMKISWDGNGIFTRVFSSVGILWHMDDLIKKNIGILYDVTEFHYQQSGLY